jgi:hypothetical protein
MYSKFEASKMDKKMVAILVLLALFAVLIIQYRYQKVQLELPKLDDFNLDKSDGEDKSVSVEKSEAENESVSVEKSEAEDESVNVDKSEEEDESVSVQDIRQTPLIFVAGHPRFIFTSFPSNVILDP